MCKYETELRKGRRSQAIMKRYAAKPEKISKYSSIFPITLQHTTVSVTRAPIHSTAVQHNHTIYSTLITDSHNCIRASGLSSRQSCLRFNINIEDNASYILKGINFS